MGAFVTEESLVNNWSLMLEWMLLKHLSFAVQENQQDKYPNNYIRHNWHYKKFCDFIWDLQVTNRKQLQHVTIKDKKIYDMFSQNMKTRNFLQPELHLERQPISIFPGTLNNRTLESGGTTNCVQWIKAKFSVFCAIPQQFLGPSFLNTLWVAQCTYICWRN